MRRRFLLCALWFLACHAKPESDRVVFRDGMDAPSEWRLKGCTIEGGVMVLSRSASGLPAIAMRPIPPLPARGSLILEVRVRGPGADDGLHVDLWGEDWDDPCEEIAVPASDLGAGFTSVTGIVPSSSPDRGGWLRLVTSSTQPIEVDMVDLLYTPRETWRGVASPHCLRAHGGSSRW